MPAPSPKKVYDVADRHCEMCRETHRECAEKLQALKVQTEAAEQALKEAEVALDVAKAVKASALAKLNSAEDGQPKGAPVKSSTEEEGGSKRKEADRTELLNSLREALADPSSAPSEDGCSAYVKQREDRKLTGEEDLQ
eukprot:3515765-Alexandrium_andersonii.AAC.1